MRTAVVLRRAILLVGLASVATLPACGPAPGESTGETSEAVGFANDEAAFDYFLGKGLTNFQAAGIVGNLDQESGVDPTAAQAGGPGRGIAQWSVGGRWDTDANDNATWYAGQQGQSVDSLQLQLDFIWYELTTFSGYGLAALKASTDVTAATIAFQNDFEGCGTCDQSTRIAYAQGVLSAYGNDTADGGGSGSDAGSGATPCTVPGVGTGVCILTTDCAAMPGHVSTPNYCPGAADIQCCTGPAEDAGSSSGSGDAGGGKSDAGGSSGASSSGSSGSSGASSSSSGASSSGTASSSGSGGSSSGESGSSSGAGDNGAFSPHGGSGCTAAPGRTNGPLAGFSWLALLGVVGVASRRRRRARGVRAPGPLTAPASDRRA
jgi:MYXO-CTERM domain-containing protein